MRKRINNFIISKTVAATEVLEFNRLVLVKEVYATRGVAGIASLTFDNSGMEFGAWNSNTLSNTILGNTTLRFVVNVECNRIVFNSAMDITLIYEYADLIT